MIARAASVTKSAERTSYLETDQFCYMLLSKKFKTGAKELREKIAVLRRTLASTLATCRPILLNKDSGVRPIEVYQVFERDYGKGD